jgi:hypothetical protein
VLDELGAEIIKIKPAIAVEQFSSSSPAIAFNGMWLALIHEAVEGPTAEERHHRHRLLFGVQF